MSDESPEVKRASAELVQHAAKNWFEVFSDYQQDKGGPSWDRFPQLGPTYFMSGETHYDHIFCAESCGEAAGPSRFSRSWCTSGVRGWVAVSRWMIPFRLLQTRLSVVRASAGRFLLCTVWASAPMVPLQALVRSCEVCFLRRSVLNPQLATGTSSRMRLLEVLLPTFRVVQSYRSAPAQMQCDELSGETTRQP